MTTAEDGRHARVDVDEHGVATLTITDSGSLNILGSAAMLELTASVDRLRGTPGVRVLVLRGSGDKAFIGGADIQEMSTLTPESGEAFIERLAGLCEALRELPVPVIARLSGWCLGGGLEVAMACDIRLGSSSSRYGMPEVRVGIPSVIHAAMMPRLIGGSRAGWMLMTGESIDASTALQWGLIHEVHEASRLDDAVAERALAFTELAPAALAQQKRLLRAWEELPLDEAIRASVGEFARSFATGEPQRYMASFMSRKRKS